MKEQESRQPKLFKHKKIHILNRWLKHYKHGLLDPARFDLIQKNTGKDLNKVARWNLENKRKVIFKKNK